MLSTGRPSDWVSLTSFLLKGLERLVERHIRDDFASRGLTFTAQHAFQEGPTRADDITTICRGKFLETLCDLTQNALKLVEKWCEEVGLNVNPAKTELVVFTKNRNLDKFKAPVLFGKPLGTRASSTSVSP